MDTRWTDRFLWLQPVRVFLLLVCAIVAGCETCDGNCCGNIHAVGSAIYVRVSWEEDGRDTLESLDYRLYLKPGPSEWQHVDGMSTHFMTPQSKIFSGESVWVSEGYSLERFAVAGHTRLGSCRVRPDDFAQIVAEGESCLFSLSEDGALVATGKPDGPDSDPPVRYFRPAEEKLLQAVYSDVRGGVFALSDAGNVVFVAEHGWQATPVFAIPKAQSASLLTRAGEAYLYVLAAEGSVWEYSRSRKAQVAPAGARKAVGAFAGKDRIVLVMNGEIDTDIVTLAAPSAAMTPLVTLPPAAMVHRHGEMMALLSLDRKIVYLVSMQTGAVREVGLPRKVRLDPDLAFALKLTYQGIIVVAFSPILIPAFGVMLLMFGLADQPWYN